MAATSNSGSARPWRIARATSAWRSLSGSSWELGRRSPRLAHSASNMRSAERASSLRCTPPPQTVKGAKSGPRTRCWTSDLMLSCPTRSPRSSRCLAVRSHGHDHRRRVAARSHHLLTDACTDRRARLRTAPVKLSECWQSGAEAVHPVGRYLTSEHVLHSMCNAQGRQSRCTVHDDPAPRPAGGSVLAGHLERASCRTRAPRPEHLSHEECPLRRGRPSRCIGQRGLPDRRLPGPLPRGPDRCRCTAGATVGHRATADRCGEVRRVDRADPSGRPAASGPGSQRVGCQASPGRRHGSHREQAAVGDCA